MGPIAFNLASFLIQAMTDQVMSSLDLMTGMSGVIHFKTAPMMHWSQCIQIPFPSLQVFSSQVIFTFQKYKIWTQPKSPQSISVARCSKNRLRVNICQPWCTNVMHVVAKLRGSKEYGLIPPTYRKGPFPCSCARKPNKRFHSWQPIKRLWKNI